MPLYSRLFYSHDSAVAYTRMMNDIIDIFCDVVYYPNTGEHVVFVYPVDATIH